MLRHSAQPGAAAQPAKLRGRAGEVTSYRMTVVEVGAANGATEEWHQTRALLELHSRKPHNVLRSWQNIKSRQHACSHVRLQPSKRMLARLR